MTAVQAPTGERAMEAVRDQRAKMVVLEVGLPGDGLDVSRRLRTGSDARPTSRMLVELRRWN